MVSQVTGRTRKIIKLPSKLSRGEYKGVIPGSTWACRPFEFSPRGFYVEDERMDRSKMFNCEHQDRSLANWEKDPTKPSIYVCTSNPHDLEARYFAAYLVSIHVKKLGWKANVVWKELNNSFEKIEDIVPEEYSRPTLLVLSGLCVDSTKIRLEKARDLVNKFYNIPRIIVGGGTDPVSFASVYLRTPVHKIFYYRSPLMAKNTP